MVDVFVSYAREDREIAEKLAERLQRTGFSVWWDRALLAGDSIEAAIDTALNEAKTVIVIWSETSVTSHWVCSEAATALQMGKIIPIRIDHTRLPRPYDQIQTADFSKWKGGWSRSLAALIKSIRAVGTGKRPKREHGILAKRSRRIISFGALASSALLALAVLGDISGLVSSIRGNPGDAELKGKIEQIDAKLTSAARTEPEISQLAVRKILLEFQNAGVPGDDAIFTLMQTGSLTDAINVLEDRYNSLPLDTENSVRVELLRQIAGLAIDSDPDKAKALYQNVLDLEPSDGLSHSKLSIIANRNGDMLSARYHLERASLADADSEFVVMMDQLRSAKLTAREGKLDEAMESVKLIEEQAKSHSLEQIALVALLDKSIYALALDRSNANSIIDVLDAQKPRFDSISDPSLNMRYYSTLGGMKLSAKDSKGAELAYRAQLEIAQDTDRLDAEINARKMLASALVKRGLTTEAHQHLQNALTLARETRALDVEIAPIRFVMAKAHLADGKPSKACHQILLAIEADSEGLILRRVRTNSKLSGCIPS